MTDALCAAELYIQQLYLLTFLALVRLMEFCNLFRCTRVFDLKTCNHYDKFPVTIRNMTMSSIVCKCLL